MRNHLFRGGLAVSLLSLIAGAALAQTPPAPLAGVEGLAYEGQIGGLDVWSAPGLTELFAVTPDGRTLMRGALFSGSGRDLGAVITGADPSTLLPTVETTAAVSETPAPVSVPEPAGAPAVVASGGAGFAGLRGPDTCQSPILADAAPLLAPRVGGWDEAGAGSPPPVLPRATPTQETGLVDGAEIAREAEDALAGFDPEERRELLLGLVSELRAASTQEEFLARIAAWRARIDELRVAKGMSRLFTADGKGVLPPVAAETPVTSFAPPPIEVTPLPPAVTATDGAPSEGVTAASAGSDGPSLEQSLLEDVRRNAMWFSVGANDVPAVYAFIDPTCSYSARAISALSDQVGAGELQLRVVLSPVLSQRSAGLIAAILTNEKPPLAFFDHEVSLAERGRSDLEPKEFSTLPAPVQAGIQRNFEMIRDYKIPGVPFFVYETAEGARVVSGAQEGISFPGALVDPYTGTK